jgi:hypothetical protein
MVKNSHANPHTYYFYPQLCSRAAARAFWQGRQYWLVVHATRGFGLLIDSTGSGVFDD